MIKPNVFLPFSVLNSPDLERFQYGTTELMLLTAKTMVIITHSIRNFLISVVDLINIQIKWSIFIRHPPMVLGIIVSLIRKPSKLLIILYLVYLILLRFYWERR
jgi:hypothetical protein